MELEAVYENAESTNIKDTTGSEKPSNNQNEGKEEKTQKHRGSRCLVLMTVCLGLICVVLLVSIILQHISITAERESLFKSYKNTVEEFNQTINSLQHNYTDLTQKNLELEKKQLQESVDSLSQKKLELESKVTSLSDELKKAASKRIFFPTSSVSKSWSESRQYCRDRGADLVIINTEEKQRLISSFKERMWIGLSDIENEGNMKWVDNSPLKQGFWFKGEPNNDGGAEDCIEMNPQVEPMNNWNDLPCSEKRKGICEN
ncbi:CD209 antigen-like protein E isoform X3 [Ctenopharyngodon idella]|uniref:CD209 antigen-like protein E isoform X3 n=1 Tax=Ctenopharyngodon idella TaxID=7959 RepID=UPI002230C462|nr:CD209 antigen-like protein E isoform X3 [Ctenopharyngodon idella]